MSVTPAVRSERAARRARALVAVAAPALSRAAASARARLVEQPLDVQLALTDAQDTANGALTAVRSTEVTE